MYLTAKVYKNDPVLEFELRNIGIHAKQASSGLVVELPKAQVQDNPGLLYTIPEILEDAKLFINLTEHGGGGYQGGGNAVVVCGLSGEKLRPYRTPQRGHLSNGAHAYFSTPGPCVSIQGFQRSSKIKIVQHWITMVSKRLAMIEKNVLWDDEIDQLPQVMNYFKPAIVAAKDKANHYHCREMHFGLPPRLK